ncbi:alpha-mannosidase [Nocardiopsis synnemataformans]|uniref:alpha-mannosidase n=1 Tax=Nocardiopsis synnemataformans TaxID=61305 RepID=UPI003EBD083F
MHTHPEITVERAARILRERVLPSVHTPLAGVRVHAWEVGGDGEPVPAARVLDPSGDVPAWEPFDVGSAWASAWRTTWFRLAGEMPPGEGTVELLVDLGWEDHSVGGHCEGTVYRPDGTVVKGLHPRNGWVRLRGPGASTGVVDGDGTFTLYVEAAANPLVLGLPPFLVTDRGEKDAADFEPYRLRRVELCALHHDTWELVQDVEAVAGLIAQVPDTEARHWRLLRALDRALDALDPHDVHATAADARGALADVLSRPAHATAHRLSAVGHAHIDSAWLWPVRETERKVARTVANVLHLMDADPDLVYAMSSAQQYAWLEENHPDLFARVRERVAEGRFVPVGGMWVESDAVMPSGESIVRQFTHGKRYFMDRFGVEPREVWLPDSFGYSGALPQLARRAGFRWFLTQKISWNDTNPFPHHSFRWEGIDGTGIFTHFPPVDTYAAEVSAQELRHAATNFRDKSVASHSLLPFGYGDGGGGPTREMLARTRRFADLEGAPTVAVRPPSDFFAEAEAEFEAEGAPAVWSGELYLELHRGTLTSQIAMKQGNRRAEALLRTVEYLAAAATLRTGAPYPAEEIDALWSRVLFHQFHDILPGSSISWVHREAREAYAEIDRRLRELADRAARALDDGTARPGRLVPVTASDTAVPGQDPDWWTVRRPREYAGTPAAVAPDGGGFTLDNGLLRVTVDATGHVRSVLDLAADREVVPPGQRLGALQLFRDVPVRWDAWDVDRHTLGLGRDLDDVAELRAENGDGTARVVVERRFGASTVRLTYALAPGARRLDMEADVDWHEREHLLKASLPLAVRTDTANFETQFGHVGRTVHRNTSWDEACYESCTHRYVRVDEPGYGVGVVNDSTYGADVSRLTGPGGGTLVRLSLLRGPRFPDPGTDEGRHVLRWSLVCEADPSDTLLAAYDLNAPALEALPDVAPLVRLEAMSGLAVMDCVKLADDGSGDLVVRVHEARGGRASARLGLCGSLGEHPAVTETDLLERPAEDPDLPKAWQQDRLVLGPFQVATLRVRSPHRTTDDIPRTTEE